MTLLAAYDEDNSHADNHDEGRVPVAVEAQTHGGPVEDKGQEEQHPPHPPRAVRTPQFTVLQVPGVMLQNLLDWLVSRQHIREDVNIHNYWLQPKCCSI